MTCHRNNAAYVKTWRLKNKEKFAVQHREHSRVYYQNRRIWMKISKAFLGDFREYV
jgi:hypothetical protein